MYYSDAAVYREKNLAKRYWDKLFKEYCITDLSRYKENKVILLIARRDLEIQDIEKNRNIDKIWIFLVTA